MRERSLFIAASKRPIGGPFGRLTLHFLSRFFTGEFATEQGNRGFGVGLVLTVLALPGVFVSLLLSSRYSSLIRWLSGLPPNVDYAAISIPDRYMFLAYSMGFTGLVALFEWGSILPDRLDHANLGPLPVSSRKIVIAKLTALVLFVSLFVGALNAGSTALFPLQVMGNQLSLTKWFRFTLGHAVATSAGSFFVFFFFAAVAGFLMLVLPYGIFRRISPAIQFISTIGLIALLFLTPEIEKRLPSLAGGSDPLLRWLPSVWFLGVYQNIAGQPMGSFRGLPARAWTGLWVAGAAALLFYLAAYGRHARRVRETSEPAAPGPSRLASILRHVVDRSVLDRPFDCGCFHFATSTLAKSQIHRLLLAGIIGLGAAVALQDCAVVWQGGVHQTSAVASVAVLSAPLALTFFLLTGLRMLFDLPSELPANWIFQVAADGNATDARRVSRKVMYAFFAPIVLATFAGYTRLEGLGLASAHTAVVLSAGLALTEGLLVSCSKIPFTASYGGLKHNFGIVVACYLTGYVLFSSGLAELERWMGSLVGLSGCVALFGLLATILFGVRRFGATRDEEEKTLVFVDDPEPVVYSMDLR